MPTFIDLSELILKVDGAVNDALTQDLKGFAIIQHSGEPSRCTATFNNWGSSDDGSIGYLYLDRQVLDFGKDFTVVLAPGDLTLFSGRIYGLEATFPSELSVSAFDRLQEMRMVRRTRTFEDVTLNDVVGRIAGDHGMIHNVSVSGPTFRQLAQLNQTDLEFLHSRLSETGALVWIEDEHLHVSPDRGAPQTLDWGESLREFRVNADLTTQRTRFTVCRMGCGSQVRHFGVGRCAIGPECPWGNRPTTAAGGVSRLHRNRCE